MERNQDLDLQVIKASSMKPNEAEKIVANMYFLGPIHGSSYNESDHQSELSTVIITESDAVKNAISKAKELKAELLVLRQPKHEVWLDSNGIAIIADVEGSAYKSQEVSPL